MYKQIIVIFNLIFILQSCQGSNYISTPSKTVNNQIQSAIPNNNIPSTESKLTTTENNLKPENLLKVNFKNFASEDLFSVINNKGNGYIFKGYFAKYIDNYKITDNEDIFSKSFSSTYTSASLNDEGNGFIAWDTGFSGICSASNVYAKQIENYKFSVKEYVIASHVCLPFPQVKLDNNGNGEIQWEKDDLDTKIVSNFSKKVINFKPIEEDVQLKETKPENPDNLRFNNVKIINNSGNGFLVLTKDKEIILKKITNNNISEQEIHLYKYTSYGSPPSLSINDSGNGIVVWSDFISETLGNASISSKEQIFARIIKNYQVL